MFYINSDPVIQKRHFIDDNNKNMFDSLSKDFSW